MGWRGPGRVGVFGWREHCRRGLEKHIVEPTRQRAGPAARPPDRPPGPAGQDCADPLWGPDPQPTGSGSRGAWVCSLTLPPGPLTAREQTSGQWLSVSEPRFLRLNVGMSILTFRVTRSCQSVAEARPGAQCSKCSLKPGAFLNRRCSPVSSRLAWGWEGRCSPGLVPCSVHAAALS